MKSDAMTQRRDHPEIFASITDMSKPEPTDHRRYWPNGQIKEAWSEVDGRKEGGRRFYLENGFMFSEMEFRNGVANGAIRQ